MEVKILEEVNAKKYKVSEGAFLDAIGVDKKKYKLSALWFSSGLYQTEGIVKIEIDERRKE